MQPNWCVDRMRKTFLGFAIIAALVALTFGAAAFNYASLSARAVTIDIVQDDGAYLAIAPQDPDSACYVSYAGSGKIQVSFDGGSGCAGSGTGVNAGSQYYFLDVLKITNKGNKAWQGLWLNSTDAAFKLNMTFSTDPTMTTDDTFAQNDAYVTPIAPGETVYVGFFIDASSKTTADSPWSAAFSVAARATA